MAGGPGGRPPAGQGQPAREGDAVAVTIDWDGVAAATPQLREPRIRPGDVLELRIDEHPAPEVASILAKGIVLQYVDPGARDRDDADHEHHD